ncbi:exopolyphosphatase [Sphingobacterium prati]|uniref:Ppx/GppA phosphatase family protein n=1 Tax=Sphingobacterium prati TaxID=2737006 RepID=UPI001554EDA2|nr:exopolyphosphatase [uncultured Sphingobacterium sp.]NPE47901.1 exopolyphosphatase [Sphingobacterium prati]
MRYAAIDIGSNAVRLLIADIIGHKEQYNFKKNTLLRVPLRLGDDAFIHQEISPRKAESLIKTMKAFRELMDVYQVEDYMACATSAMRDAKNGADIVAEVRRNGINIDIIEGAKEAEIIYNSHWDNKIEKDKVYLYIDVGGGSTELSLFANGVLVNSRSFNLGTIRILDNQDNPETWDELKEWVRSNTHMYKQVIGIGTGGNINKLARLSDEKVDKPLSYAKLKAVYEHLASFSLKERIILLGLNEDRADVIIPASEIFLTIMKHGRLKQIIVPRVGLVDGVIRTLINRNLVK